MVNGTNFDLPREIWLHIIDLLPLMELCVITQVSKFFYEITSNETIWKKRFHRLFGHHNITTSSFKSCCLETLKTHNNLKIFRDWAWNEWNFQLSTSEVAAGTHLKIVLVGDMGTGSTSIIQWFRCKTPQQRETIGVEFATIPVQYKGIQYKLECWTFGSQDRWRTKISSAMCARTFGLVVVFDVANRGSWTSVQDYWIPGLKHYAKPEMQFLIAGNLDNNNRKVSEEEAIKYARSINAMYVEVSPQTGHNIEFLFAALVNQATTVVEQKKATCSVS